MRIELPSLEGTEGKFAHAYEPRELVLNDERVRLAEPPQVSGRIIREGRKLRVEGRVQARAQVECDRCLQQVELPVDTKLKLEYVTTEDYQVLRVAELSEEDLTLSVFDGAGIDIDEIVREQLLLAVPSHVLCHDNCSGFCPVCGADRNAVDCSCQASETDPRWAGLKELVNRKS